MKPFKEFHLHVHFHANQTHFHLNGFARRLFIKMRQRATQKWPILSCYLHIHCSIWIVAWIVAFLAVKVSNIMIEQFYFSSGGMCSATLSAEKNSEDIFIYLFSQFVILTLLQIMLKKDVDTK